MGQCAVVWSAMIRCWSVISRSTSADTGRSSRTRTSRTKRRACPHSSLSKASFGSEKTSRKSSIPGPDTEFTPDIAAISAEPNVSAPACASISGPSEIAMYDCAGSPIAFATSVYAASSWNASIADIGDVAAFMWNVAGAPPKSTGAPGRTTWAIVIPASTSTVWKTVAPTVVTGATRPMSVTGTISTGIPASTQSIRFWQESSEYRKLPVAVIVKMDMGRARRSSRPDRKSVISSTIRGTPCSVNAPDTTAFREFVSTM